MKRHFLDINISNLKRGFRKIFKVGVSISLRIGGTGGQNKKKMVLKDEIADAQLFAARSP